jgi:polyisoprenoid-binding protein YceI
VIKASSDKIKGVIDAASNQFAFSVDISSFNGFNSSLQREHFNEKYMETEKYPVAQFSGKIIEQIDFTRDGTYEVRAKGDLNIHGQKQVRIIKAKIVIKEGVINMDADFNVPLADHTIKIPTIINEKIATEIEVSIAATLGPQLNAGANIDKR